MNVGIVTVPIGSNYGGILQCYTLARSCRQLGTTAWIINQESSKVRYFRKLTLTRLFTNKIRQLIGYLLISIAGMNRTPSIVGEKRNKNFYIFLQKFLPHRIPFDSEISTRMIDLYVVGSDQIWRVSYIDDLRLEHFCNLNFASMSQVKRSFSYAASFGSNTFVPDKNTHIKLDEWKHQLKHFKSISVREFSGIRICKEVFGVDAVQMPDPTLLATLEDYERVINSEKTRVPKAPYFASYVLDDSTEASQLLGDVEKSTGLYHQRLLPKSTARKRCDRFYCTVAQWLRYMRDCDAVVTDSFHGCVFSIIYNKPFVCLGNEGRGSARFDTLFQVFGLEDRLVSSRDPEEVLRVLRQPLDWQRVNAIHEAERRRGLDFLRSNLYDEASPHEHK